MTTFGSTPAAAYSTVLSQEANSAAKGNSILGELGGQALPTVGLSGLQGQAIQKQLTAVPIKQGLTNAYQTAMAGYTTGQLGIKQTQLNLQGQGYQQQQAYNTQANQLEQQQYGIEQQQYGLQKQTFQQQYQEAALQHRTAVKNLQNSNAQSGVQGSTGQKLASTTLAQNYGFQVANIARSTALSTLGQQSKTLGQQSALAGQKYSTEQLANAQTNLGYLSKSNGLSQTEVSTRLQYGIASNQLSAEETIVGLLTKLGGVWSGNVSNIAALASSGGYINGVNMFTPPATSSQSNTQNQAVQTEHAQAQVGG